MKVLIQVVFGFHLATLLIEKGFMVDMTDIVDEKKFDDDLVKLLQIKNCKYIKCNLLESNQLEILINNYDLIVHLAAIVRWNK